MSNILQGLNQNQIDVVTTIEGPVLCIAGAGAGKTTTLVRRVAWMIKKGIDPSKIRVMTFTKKAANMMIDRCRSYDEAAKMIRGGTFHSFGLQLVYKYHSVLGLSNNLTVIDQEDAENAVEICVKKLNFRNTFVSFPPKGAVHKIISYSTNNKVSLKKTIKKLHPEYINELDNIAKIADTYISYKIDQNVIDYDDCLSMSRLLLDIPEILKAEQDLCEYLLVDEYQDTNLTQAEIVKLLGGEKGNVMVVGDPAQSIYSFRGALHQNIFDFEKFWSNCKVIYLDINYRSTQGILDVANNIDESMSVRYPRKMIPTLEHLEGSKPTLITYPTERDESQDIVTKILEYRNLDIPFEEQAILVRSMTMGRHIEIELIARKIPYVVVGGIRLEQTSHVKDILSILKVYENIKDEISWYRILKLFPGVGNKTVDSIFYKIENVYEMNDIIDILKEHDHGKVNTTPLRESLDVCGLNLGVGDKIARIVDYMIPVMKQNIKYREDFDGRIKDLESLVTLASGFTSVSNFISTIVVDGPILSERVDEAKKTEPPMTISTIHGAKGLEWDVVYIPKLIDGHMPSWFSKDLEAREEELRIFYVGVTRAKKYLHLSITASTDGSRMTAPSPFIDETKIRKKMDSSYYRKVQTPIPKMKAEDLKQKLRAFVNKE